jgi:glycosyltransferase involved in cell wall biosynthesis
VRILFVTHNIPRFSGDAAGSFVLRLAIALQGAGAHVDVIAPGGAGLQPVERLEGVVIHRVRYGRDEAMTLAYDGTMAETVRASMGGKVALLRLLRAFRSAVRAQLATAVRAGEPYDVVHAHWWFPAGLSLWRAFSPKDPPVVITMHGSDVRLAQGIAPARRLMRSVLSTAAVRTGVSSWLADRASRIAPGLRIHVDPMPVDTDSFVPSAAPRQGMLFVGRLNAQKGLASLLDAMARPALHGVMLDVVGDGPDAAALHAQADTLALRERVRWHGALPQQALVPRYQGAAVLALPSTEEGLGLVAVEAQLCETPVVAFASGGVPDVVRIDAGGTLVTPGDIDSFADALARMLADPDMAQREGRRAREAMLAHFSPDAVAQRYLAHYRAAMTGEAGGR